MSDIAIRVENLSKYYRLGTIGGATLREDFSRWWARKLGRPDPYAKVDGTKGWHERGGELWALHDVNLDIHEGEILGIVGRNGAGKSTLLKIISRITAPTTGSVKIRGRVGSLLEVGTGFHSELTGRENVYLNGTILGMSHREVESKLEEIVEFAGMAKFIDTPVKRYSSGMTVRLAFAVAAHLEPEILVVDEVLAVGDAAFQKKCIGRMNDIAGHGRTILFVSHNMGAITQLCPQAILMDGGRLKMRDHSEKVVEQYLTEGHVDDAEVCFDPEERITSPAVITRCWLEDDQGKKTNSFGFEVPVRIGIEVRVRESLISTDVTVLIGNARGQPLFTTNLSDTGLCSDKLEPSLHRFTVSLPNSLLVPDYYSVTIGVHRHGIGAYDLQENVLSFHIEETCNRMWQYRAKDCGNFMVDCLWRIE